MAEDGGFELTRHFNHKHSKLQRCSAAHKIAYDSRFGVKWRGMLALNSHLNFTRESHNRLIWFKLKVWVNGIWKVDKLEIELVPFFFKEKRAT